MEFLKLLNECPNDLLNVVTLVRKIISIICWVIPIILIVMGIMDIAKVVTAGNNDEKETKAATKKLATRVAYAVVVFLIPTIISLVFRVLPITGKISVTQDGASTATEVEWSKCWEEAKTHTLDLS